jgi:hypothetical protein
VKLLPDDVDDAVTARIADEPQSSASLVPMLDRVRGAWRSACAARVSASVSMR